MTTLLVETTCVSTLFRRRVQARVVGEYPRFVVVEIPGRGGPYRESFWWDELPRTRERREDVILRMYRQGYTYQQIERSVGVSYKQVTQVIQRAVISGRVRPRRPKRWAGKRQTS